MAAAKKQKFEDKIQWKPEKLRAASGQTLPKAAWLTETRAELYRFSWKQAAEDKIRQRAPRSFRLQAVAAWPVALVAAAHTDEAFWTNLGRKAGFIEEC